MRSWHFGLFAGLGVLLCAMPAARGFGLVTGTMGADALAAKIEEWNNDLRAEANDAATRAKLFDRLKQAREELMPIKDNTNRGLEQLRQRLEQMRGEIEGNPAGWPAEQRAEWERTSDAVERLEGVGGTLETAWDNLRWLQGRQNVEGFNPFVNEMFKERFAALGQQVDSAATAFGEFNALYNVETADRTDENSHVVVVPAGVVRARNTSDQMLFIVNGVTLEPGETQEFDIRLSDHRGLTVRAVGFDDKRKQLRSVRDRLEEGGGQARLMNIDAEALYTIKYGTDTLTTTMTAVRESYRWSWGTNVTRAIGERSPWAPGGPVIVEPELDDSAPERRQDSFTWWVPAVEDGSVTFSFTANATVEWKTERTRDGASLGAVDDTLLSDGTLEVVVSTR